MTSPPTYPVFGLVKAKMLCQKGQFLLLTTEVTSCIFPRRRELGVKSGGNGVLVRR